MDIRTIINDLSGKLGPPKNRAAFGQWIPASWVVRGLVERGHGITDAVREVLESTGMGNNKQAFGSLRAAFYRIRHAEWPPGLSNAAVKKTTREFSLDTTFE